MEIVQWNVDKQSGVVEACWAHNPEVRGSKPHSAMIIFGHKIYILIYILKCVQSSLTDAAEFNFSFI